MKVGDIVYTQSSERNGKAHIIECVVERVTGDTLLLYAVYDNRSLYREAKDVLTYDELMEDIKVIEKDQQERVLFQERVMKTVYEVHQLRTDGSYHFGSSSPIAVCETRENAQRIVNSLNKNSDERILFTFGVMEKSVW